jgi:5-methylcytosine-specific restriction protein A
MPYAPPRPCPHPGCPNFTPGGLCREHRNQADREIKSQPAVAARRQLYASARWRRLRRRILRARPWCATLGCPNLATDVDHIVALRDGGEPWDETNLQPLCAKHHDQKTAREVFGFKATS